MPKNKTASKKANSGKKIRNTIIVLVGLVLVFLICSMFIVVNDCASPCRHDRRKNTGGISAEVSCPAVCEKETLFQRMFGL